MGTNKIMEKMMKLKEINRKIMGILIIILFLNITINMSMTEGIAPTIKEENNYSISGTVYKYPTDNTVPGVEVIYYDGYGQYFKNITDSNGKYLIEFNTNPEYNNKDYVVAAKNVKYECALLFVENLIESYDLWVATPGSGKIYGYIRSAFDDYIVEGVEVKLTYCIQPSIYKNITTTSSSSGYYEFTNLNIEPCNNAPLYSYELNISSYYRYIRIGEYGNFEFKYDMKSKNKFSIQLIQQILQKILENFPFLEKILNQIIL